MAHAWWQSGAIYQIYPRSFRDADGDGIGDLRGIAERLDYCASLGVDALWLSPIYPSPMADFGYDISDFTGIDPLFGTLAQFDELLAGIKRRELWNVHFMHGDAMVASEDDWLAVDLVNK